MTVIVTVTSPTFKFTVPAAARRRTGTIRVARRPGGPAGHGSGRHSGCAAQAAVRVGLVRPGPPCDVVRDTVTKRRCRADGASVPGPGPRPAATVTMT